MEIVIGWFVFAVVAGIIANARGRSGFGYFLLSLLLSPIIGILLAACLPSRMYVDANGVIRRVTQAAPVEPTESQKRAEFLVVLAILVAIAAVFAVYFINGNVTYLAGQ